MLTIWNVQRRKDGTFLLWIHGDERRPLLATNEAGLVRQMNANGVLDEWQANVLDQLAKGDTAEVELPPRGKFSQGIP
jgi:hypothetical protein